MKSKDLSRLALDALEALKGQSISVIEVDKLTPLTDYMIVVTGTSNTHINAMADALTKKVKESGTKIVGVEGRPQGEWVLVDLGGVVVHLMLASARALYNLEDLWSFTTAGTG